MSQGSGQCGILWSYSVLGQRGNQCYKIWGSRAVQASCFSPKVTIGGFASRFFPGFLRLITWGIVAWPLLGRGSRLLNVPKPLPHLGVAPVCPPKPPPGAGTGYVAGLMKVSLVPPPAPMSAQPVNQVSPPWALLLGSRFC